MCIRDSTYTELLTRTGGGLLVEPENATALEDILLRLDSDRANLTELGRRATEGVRQHYNISEMTIRALDVYQRLANQHR